VTIDTSNITLPMVRANKDFAVDKELTIAGRPALTSHVNGQDAQADCVINVEVKGGSLEISVENPPLNQLAHGFRLAPVTRIHLFRCRSRDPRVRRCRLA